MTRLASARTVCPGCRLERPRSGRTYDRKFHASAECWEVYEQVLAAEFQNAVLFGRVHQLTVDTYAVQHAGGRHPDKSVGIHLTGLFLVLERGLPPTAVPPLLQRLAGRPSWPYLAPPAEVARFTVADVARAVSPDEHVARARAWAEEVWRTWTPHHAVARELARGIAGAPAG